MKLLSHGPEPCASANSAIPALKKQPLNFFTRERQSRDGTHNLTRISNYITFCEIKQDFFCKFKKFFIELGFKAPHNVKNSN